MENPTPILVIDDNLFILKTISEFLVGHYPYRWQILATAQNGRDGIISIEEFSFLCYKLLL